MADFGTLGEARVAIRGDLKTLDKDFKAAERNTKRAVGKLGKQFDGLKTSVAGSVAPIAAFTTAIADIGLVALGVKLVNATKAAVAFADQIGKTAAKVGLSTDALQELRFAADQSGVAMSVFDMGIQRFSRRVGEAAQGQGELKDTLEQYDIAVRDAEGRTRDLEDILGDYADVVANAESEQEQLRLAFKAFDSEAAIMVNLLRKGKDGVSALRQQARDLGFVFDQQTIKQAAKLNEQLKIVGQVVDVNVNRALLALAPTMIRVANAFAKAAPEIGIATENLLGFSSLDFLGSAALERRLDGLKDKLESVNNELAAIGEGSRIRETRGRESEGLEAEIAEIEALIPERRAEEELIAGALAGGGGGTSDDLEERAKRIAKVEEALKFELDQLGRNIFQQRLQSELRKVGLKETDAEADGINNLVISLDNERLKTEAANKAEEERLALKEEIEEILEANKTRTQELNDELARSKELYDATDLSAEDYRATQERIAKELAELEEQTRGVGDVLADNIDSALRSNIESWEDLRDAAVNAIQDIILDLLKLEGTLEDGKSLLGGFVDILIGAFSGAIAPSAGGAQNPATTNIRPSFAHGGRPAVGQLSIVGELGPELFIPDVSGTIIPNSQLIATPEGGPAGNVVNIDIDARGADAGVVAQLRLMERRIINLAKAETFEDINRGGSAAKIVGRRG